jgi:replicative superfamily II helicase
MTIRAAFIGIDRFSDPKIRDLQGARRDAEALWALFSDSLSGLQAQLLVDHQATAEAVRQALDDTLASAGPEDTVILSFAGHGSRDHHLVVHDSVKGGLPRTAIPMKELARKFRESSAKAVLCILDCCFSGEAPARVIEDSPAIRDEGNPLESIAGAGRVLISACAMDEVALEHPTTRHGLLTQAIIRTFQSNEPAVSIAAAMDTIMSQVRADAQRLGHTQTPVLLGFVEGGMTIRSLKPGQRFFEKFPEKRGHRVSAKIEELAIFGIPQAIVDQWIQAFLGGLNQLQLSAVNDYRILDGESLLVVAPTSSGKTFLGEMAAARAIAESRKAVFLFPYKALVNEKFDQFSRLYGDRLQMRVIRCTGDYRDNTTAFVQGKYDLAVLTYEMFLGLVLSKSATLNQMGLIVVDETQFITDPGRGITVELLLTFVLSAREQGVAPQLLALSAVIGPLNSFDGWLGCKSLVTDKRPVPLIEGVLDRNGILQRKNADGSIEDVPLLSHYDIQQRRNQPSAQDVIVPLVKKLLKEKPSERVIVFRNTRGAAEGCAAYLAKGLGLPPAKEAQAALPVHDLSGASTSLRECLSGGTAFHNSNLNREEREIVERAYREADGKILVLAATTTVAAGINTPASTVILAENEFVGEDGRPFTIAEYKNMAGRAGRLGFSEEGRSIILADNPTERQQLFSRYVMGQPERLESSFDVRQLETWILRLLTQVKKIPRNQVTRLLANTYGGYLASRQNPEWHNEAEKRLTTILAQMIEFQLIEQDAGIVHLTLLGQACGRSALAFSSILRLLSILKRHQGSGLTAVNLMVLLQALPEADSTYTPLMKKGQWESRWPQRLAMQFGNGLASALQQQAEDVPAYWARCKRAMILWSWIGGQPLEQIESTFSANPYQGVGHGDVRRIADATRYNYGSAYQIVSLLLMQNGPNEDAVEKLLRQLEVGIPEDALELLNLPISLTRGDYLELHKAGFKTPNDVWTADRDKLETILGIPLAAQVHDSRPK